MAGECVVFTTVPAEKAADLARRLVEQRLAACVNSVPVVESFYWWEDKVRHENESLLIIKTTSQRFSQLTELVKSIHPYDLPEIIALPIGAGLPEYLEWIQKETKQ